MLNLSCSSILFFSGCTQRCRALLGAGWPQVEKKLTPVTIRIWKVLTEKLDLIKGRIEDPLISPWIPNFFATHQLLPWVNTVSFNSIATNKLKNPQEGNNSLPHSWLPEKKNLKAEIYFLLLANKLKTLTEIGNKMDSRIKPQNEQAQIPSGIRSKEAGWDPHPTPGWGCRTLETWCKREFWNPEPPLGYWRTIILILRTQNPAVCPGQSIRIT